MKRRNTHSTHTNTHTPSVLSLGWNEIPLKTGGPAIPLEGFKDSREWHPLHTDYLFLLYGTKYHLLEFGFSCFCQNRNQLTEAAKDSLDVQPSSHSSKQAAGEQLTHSDWKPAVATVRVMHRGQVPSASWWPSIVHLWWLPLNLDFHGSFLSFRHIKMGFRLHSSFSLMHFTSAPHYNSNISWQTPAAHFSEVLIWS